MMCTELEFALDCTGHLHVALEKTCFLILRLIMLIDIFCCKNPIYVSLLAGL